MANMTDRLSALMDDGKELAMQKWCLPKWAVALAAVILVLALASCQTSLVIPTELLQAQATCHAAKQNVKTLNFTDPRDQLLVEMGRALADATGKNGCDSAVNQYMASQGKVIEAQYALGSKTIGVLGLIGGIYATGSAIEGIVGAAGKGGISAVASGDGSSVSVTQQTFSSKIGDVGGNADLGGFMTQPAQEPVIVQPSYPPVEVPVEVPAL